MNAILIDPKSELIQLIELNKFDLDELKRTIDCDMIELAITFEDIHADIYCDEEGWLRNREIYGFELDGVLIPSRAVVVGCTENGDQCALSKAKLTYLLNLLVEQVEWRGELTEDDMPYPSIEVFTF